MTGATPDGTQAVWLHGDILRADRKARFASAAAFADSCGASTPTIYRAERGGPVRYSYVASMARSLREPVEKYLRPQEGTDSLGGTWSGFLIAADQKLQPYLVVEDITLLDEDGQVTGRGSAVTPQGARTKIFRSCTRYASVFFGAVDIEGWEKPSGAGTFTLTVSRNRRRMEGFASWYDPDSDRIECSRYIWVRHVGADFELYRDRVLEIMAEEIRFYNLRKTYETTYSMQTALAQFPQKQQG